MKFDKTLFRYFVIFFLALALFNFLQMLVSSYILHPRDFKVFSSLIYVTHRWGLWLLFVPLIIKLVHKYPFSSKNWHITIILYFIFGIGITILYQFTFRITQYLYNNKALDSTIEDLLRNLFYSYDPEVSNLTYWSIILILNIIMYNVNLRKKEHTNFSLQSSLNIAKLDSLKAQIEPHFIFNSLNTLSSFILENKHKDALSFLEKFSELFRISLSKKNESETTLLEEIQFTRTYLELYKLRFQDKFEYRFDIDSNTKNCLVPTLLLQPIVENAFKHGLNTIEEVGKVDITSHTSGTMLIISIQNNGEKLASQISMYTGNGIGLKNIRSRLKTMYNENYTLDFNMLQDGGLTVIIKIPIKRDINEH